VANLTLTIDDAVLRRARIRALEQGTSVNSVVRHFLEGYAGVEERVAAMVAFVELTQAPEAGADSDERVWTRDELYDEATG
jgi:hypothetical protein